MSRRNVAEVVRGGGMFLALVKVLTDKVEDRGGHIEQLHYLTTRHGQENLNSVVDHLLALPWRAPKSALMRISRECSIREGNDLSVATSDEYFFWEMGLREYGIPFVPFRAEEDSEKGAYSAEELRSELHGKPLQPDMKVCWRGDEYYLTAISFGREAVKAGDVIDIGNIDFIHLALTKYIDIDN